MPNTITKIKLCKCECSFGLQCMYGALCLAIFHNQNAYLYGIHMHRVTRGEIPINLCDKMNKRTRIKKWMIRNTNRWNLHFTMEAIRCYISAWVIYGNQKLKQQKFRVKKMYNVFPRGFSFVCPCRLSAVEFTFSQHKKSTTEIKIEHVLVRLVHHEHTKCEINRKPWHRQKMS